MKKSYLETINDKVVEAQNKYGYNKEMKQTLEVFEPGESGFKPRKGYVLLSMVTVKARTLMFEEKKIILNPNDESKSSSSSNSLSASDFLGVNVSLFVVAEASEESDYKPGQIVFIDSFQNRSMYQHCITVKNTYGFNVPESFITGKIDNL